MKCIIIEEMEKSVNYSGLHVNVFYLNLKIKLKHMSKVKLL